MSVEPVEILVAEAEGMSEDAVAALRRAGRVTLGDLDRPALLRAVGGAAVLWVRLRHRIDAEVLDAAPELRAVATPTTGLNHIDLDEAARRGISVLSLRGETEFLKNVRATAEHTVNLILALLRHTPAAARHVTEGGWSRDLFRGEELQGKTVGIVGYGRLGRIVARYLNAFDATLLASDVRDDLDADPWVTVVPLPELFFRSDIVTLHASLTPESHGFFGREQFARMKPGARFINTARGELIDEVALLECLQDGRLAGAALDVLSGERPAGMGDHPLVRYARENANVIITPHVGGCTRESMETTERFLAEKVARFLGA